MKIITHIVTLLFVVVLLTSCSSSKYFLSNTINGSGSSFTSQPECYHSLLALTQKNIDKISVDEFIRALSDLAAVQLFDTLDEETFSKFNHYILANIKQTKKLNISHFLNCLLAHKMSQATAYYAKIPAELYSGLPVLRVLPIYYFRLGNARKAVQYAMEPKYSQIIDDLTPYAKRAINIYQVLIGNFTYSTIASINKTCSVTAYELEFLFPRILAKNDTIVLTHILSLNSKLPFSDKQVIGIIASLDSLGLATVHLDTMISGVLQSKKVHSGSVMEYIGNLVCEKGLKLSALTLSGLIDSGSNIPAVSLVKLGWIIISDSMEQTAKLWEIATSKLDTSSYEYKSTDAFITVLKATDSLAMFKLNRLIKQFPEKVLPRKVYLPYLLEKYDLDQLITFLRDTKTYIDSISYDSDFSDIYFKATLCKLSNVFTWANKRGKNYWVYQDSTGSQWLYDKNFDPVNARIFVNKNGEVRIWVYNEEKEYLYDDNNTYLDQFRFKNQAGEYVNVLIKDSQNYYYDADFNWTGFKSYTNKNSKEIYIKVTDNFDYYYNDSLEYMHIKSYRAKDGSKMYIEEKGNIDVYYDSLWNKTGLIGFPSVPKLLAIVYSDNAKFYYSNEDKELNNLNLTIYKNTNGVPFLEDGDKCRFYYNAEGSYLGWNVWINNGSISSIAIAGGGDCKQFIVGTSDLSECTAFDNVYKANLFKQKAYLNTSLIKSVASLFNEKTETPLEIFSTIVEQIENRKHEETALAILEGINQGLQAYNNTQYSSKPMGNSNLYSNYSGQFSSNSDDDDDGGGDDGSTTNGDYSLSTQNYIEPFNSSNRTPSTSSKYFNYSDNSSSTLSGTSSNIGKYNYTNVSGNNGYTGHSTSYNIGRYNYTDYSDNRGTSGHGTAYNIGKTNYYDYNDNKGNTFNATSQKIGNYEYLTGHDNSMNSYSGTSTKIGNFIYHNVTTTDGKRASGTTYKIGNTTYTDWNVNK